MIGSYNEAMSPLKTHVKRQITQGNTQVRSEANAASLLFST